MKSTNLDLYGHAPLLWSRAQAELAAGGAPAYWLATVRPDGAPHVVAVGAVWVDGKFYFTSGPGTRKSRDLAQNPRCVLSASLPTLDLSVEGRAERVTDAATLERLAQHFAAGGWPARVSGDALTAEYSAPSAGRPPWYLYVVRPVTAYGVATAEPHGATRWEFDA